jgi:putative PEP-CTERM system histidine kinase
MTIIVIYVVCAAAYLALAVGALVNAGRRRRPGRTGVLLAAGCLATAAWAAAGAADWRRPLDGLAGQFDLLRAGLWYLLILHLCHRVTPDAVAGGARLRRTLVAVAVAALAVAGIVLALGGGIQAGGNGGEHAALIIALGPDQIGLGTRLSLPSGGLLLRLVIAVCQLLLVENLYRNTPDELRWNINLTCLALGGLAVFDAVLCADAALFHVASPALLEARPVVATLVTPLLALAAARNRNWEIDLHISRRAVFHSATLLVSGIFLLVLALVGEVVRRFGSQIGPNMGMVGEVSLLFAGLMTGLVLLASGSARSALRRAVVDHFFTSRFDYRQEWMRCLDTLSRGGAGTPLHRRVIRAVVQVVDSPGGTLLLREPGEPGMHWAGGWNMPPLGAPVAAGHALLGRLASTRVPLVLSESDGTAAAPLDALPQAWLAVPLLQDAELLGCIVAARPRAPFRLDAEVFDLLGILAHEARSYLAEQRAAQTVVEARELREYGQRFAFVAHDIKNVSGQLSMLLSNAETHIANPEFQRDMLATVRASVNKIGGLIRRLQQSDDPLAGTTSGDRVSLPERLHAMAAATQRVRGTPIEVEQDGWRGQAAIAPAAFDAVLTHLLDNAIEASPPQTPVRLRLKRSPGRIALDIVDRGHGMTAEFIRDHLFRPLYTSKPHGSGIGAYQARALLREVGGDLLVESLPGQGTTMHLLLPEPAPNTVASAAQADGPSAALSVPSQGC